MIDQAEEEEMERTGLLIGVEEAGFGDGWDVQSATLGSSWISFWFLVNNLKMCQVWWHAPLLWALGRQRQAALCKLQASPPMIT